MKFPRSKYIGPYTPGETFLVSYEQFTPNKALKDYIRSYEETSDSLMKPILKREYSDPIEDLYLFPLLFMWRQILELELKRIIMILNFRFNKNYHIESGHGLQDLYDKALPFLDLKEIDKGIKPRFKKIRNLIDFYTSFDKQSQTFRYPHNRDKMKHLFGSKQQYVKVALIQSDLKDFLNITLYLEGELDELFGNSVA